MPNITPSQLVTINLKFGSHAKPLKVLAFADIASNALFVLDREVELAEVATEMARLLGLPRLEEKLAREALDTVKGEKKAILSRNKWQLTKEARTDIEKERGASDAALEALLKRHFPGAIDQLVLRDWFLNASSDFFGFNGEEWVKSISKNPNSTFSKPQTICELLTPSIAAANLGAFQNQLVDAYNAFLISEDLADRQFVMNLGFALLSAKLVSAHTGADPITIEEIRGGTFVLDTNTLFAIQLDSHRLAKSIQALGAALKEISADLVFTHPTKEEYKRVFVGRKNEIIGLFRDFPTSVVLEAENPFIESGVYRGCKNLKDFETFFGEIINPPTQLASGDSIVEFDDSGIEAEIKKAEKDTTLKNSLQRHCLKLRAKWDKRPKTESALNHDAALIRITESLQKTKPKTWILSLDRSLRSCAAERAGAHSLPTVFMLDGLIQILAVHSGGPQRDASDFAPLLTSIILNRCNPSERTYTLQDLRWLHSIQERVSDFSPENIKKLVNIVTQHRLSGATPDDKKLQLAVNRAYQDVKKEYDQELEDARERRNNAESAVEVATEQLREAEKEISVYHHSDCIKKERRKLLRGLLWRIPVSLAGAVAVYFLAVLALPTTSAGWMDWTASLVGFIAIVGGLLTKPIRAYKAGTKTCSIEHLAK